MQFWIWIIFLWCYSVFWDLYCAAPERRDTCEHSSEAKAFHDYVSSFVYPPCSFVDQYSGSKRGNAALSTRLTRCNRPAPFCSWRSNRKPAHAAVPLQWTTLLHLIFVVSLRFLGTFLGLNLLFAAQYF